MMSWAVSGLDSKSLALKAISPEENWCYSFLRLRSGACSRLHTHRTSLFSQKDKQNQTHLSKCTLAQQPLLAISMLDDLYLVWLDLPVVQLKLMHDLQVQLFTQPTMVNDMQHRRQFGALQYLQQARKRRLFGKQHAQMQVLDINDHSKVCLLQADPVGVTSLQDRAYHQQSCMFRSGDHISLSYNR